MTERALQSIRSEVWAFRGVETGGALVGYLVADQIAVTHASGPGPRGRRKRMSVTIDGAFTTEFAYRLQSASGGQLYYVGDWHIHPNGRLEISPGDCAAIRRQLEVGASFTPYLVSLIVSANVDAARGYLVGGSGAWTEVTVDMGVFPCG